MLAREQANVESRLSVCSIDAFLSDASYSAVISTLRCVNSCLFRANYQLG